MNPETIKALRQHTPELQDFREFIASEIAKLNTITDFSPDINTDAAMATEVVARKRAIDTLERILEPLLTVDSAQPANMQEYVVE
jgi:hypothetical protein